MYTKIGVVWIDIDKIVPEDVAAHDNFGTSVTLLGRNVLFGRLCPSCSRINW